MTRGRVVRSCGLALGLTIACLTVGLPRWLADESGRSAGARVDFAKLCHEHGRAPRPASGSGGKFLLCTVRYGRHVYLMDTITRDGFDAETARFQHQGCDEEARRAERASRRSWQRRATFVYHLDTGVCEHRP